MCRHHRGDHGVFPKKRFWSHIQKTLKALFLEPRKTSEQFIISIHHILTTNLHTLLAKIQIYKKEKLILIKVVKKHTCIID